MISDAIKMIKDLFPVRLCGSTITKMSKTIYAYMGIALVLQVTIAKIEPVANTSKLNVDPTETEVANEESTIDEPQIEGK